MKLKLFIALAIVLLFIYIAIPRPYIFNNIVPASNLNIDFDLIDTKSKHHTMYDYKDKTLVIVFGYRTCTTVCPITLLEWSKIFSSLDNIELLFIDVSKKIYPKLLDKFLNNYDPKFKGIVGSRESILKIANDLDAQLSYGKALNNGDDNIVHTGLSFVFKNTKLKLIIVPGLEYKSVIEDLRHI